MILKAIAESFPMSVGVALSPMLIAVIVLIFMTGKAKTNAASFFLGWMLGLLMIGVIIFMIPVSQSEGGKPTSVAGYLRIGVGILLLFFAIRQWLRRPRPDEVIEPPKFLSDLDNFSPRKFLLTGFLLVVINPKNVILSAAGAAAIDLQTANLGQQFFAYAVFIMIASSPIVIPMIPYFVSQEKAKTLFESWKVWLFRNNQTVLAVILVIFGGLILVRGMGMVTN